MIPTTAFPSICWSRQTETIHRCSAAMGLEHRRQTIKAQREQLINELETVYMDAFERIGQLDLGEGAVARLTQLMLRSREAAITPLQEEIEKPVITTPGQA